MVSSEWIIVVIQCARMFGRPASCPTLFLSNAFHFGHLYGPKRTCAFSRAIRAPVVLPNDHEISDNLRLFPRFTRWVVTDSQTHVTSHFHGNSGAFWVKTHKIIIKKERNCRSINPSRYVDQPNPFCFRWLSATLEKTRRQQYCFLPSLFLNVRIRWGNVTRKKKIQSSFFALLVWWATETLSGTSALIDVSH